MPEKIKTDILMEGKRRDHLMYIEMENRELQRELEHLQTKIDAVELEAMGKIYNKG